MFALAVQYLTGVVYATDPASREQPEWPPHPDRVFMAMVAAHHETDAAPLEREALRWLEQLGPPSIAASATGEPRRAVTSFVPVNDTQAPRVKPGHAPSSSQIDDGVSLLPEHRSRQPRTFPAIVPHDPAAFFIWPEADPDPSLTNAVDLLCRKVVRVGHSASLVQMWVEPDPPAPTLQPTTASPRVRLRVSGDGRLAALEARYPERRPTPSLWAGYGPRAPEALTAPRGSAFSPDLLVFRRVSGRPLGLESTSLLADIARRAILALASEPIPEWVSGHAADGSRTTRPHLALLPLADVGHQYADGHLLGLGLALPSTISNEQVAESLGRLIGAGDTGEIMPFSIFDGSLLDWTVELDLRATRPAALDPDTWTGPPLGARRWASVTPVVLDRFPKKDGDAERTVIAACEHAGLPQPTEVITAPVSLVAGAPTAWSMPPLGTRAGKGSRLHAHVVITFPEPVRGPVIIGAGRYRGYGLCRPLPAVDL